MKATAFYELVSIPKSSERGSESEDEKARYCQDREQRSVNPVQDES